jgi:hypothetical protein
MSFAAAPILEHSGIAPAGPLFHNPHDGKALQSSFEHENATDGLTDKSGRSIVNVDNLDGVL